MKFNNVKVGSIVHSIDINVDGVIEAESKRGAVNQFIKEMGLSIGLSVSDKYAITPKFMKLQSVSATMVNAVELTDNDMYKINVSTTVQLDLNPKLVQKHVKEPLYWQEYIEHLASHIIALMPSATGGSYNLEEVVICDDQGREIPYPNHSPDLWIPSDQAVYMLYDGFLEHWDGRGVMPSAEKIDVSDFDLHECKIADVKCIGKAFDINANLSAKKVIEHLLDVRAVFDIAEQDVQISSDLRREECFADVAIYQLLSMHQPLEAYSRGDLEYKARLLGITYSDKTKDELAVAIRDFVQSSTLKEVEQILFGG